MGIQSRFLDTHHNHKEITSHQFGSLGKNPGASRELNQELWEILLKIFKNLHENVMEKWEDLSKQKKMLYQVLPEI